jgi:DNA polymerase elongation subunit (family B)
MNKKCVIDIETESIDPKEGRIICIGLKDVESGKTIVFYDDSELELLRSFLDFFHNKGFNEIIGYNVMFDIRYIFARCLKYGIQTNGFFKSEFNDLMHTMKSVRKIWSMNRPGTLEEWSEFLFDDGKIPLSKSIKELFDSGRVTDIINYNKRDVELTFRIWKRVDDILWS